METLSLELSVKLTQWGYLNNIETEKIFAYKKVKVWKNKYLAERIKVMV